MSYERKNNMGGAPVSGFTNRQIYNTFGASGPLIHEMEHFNDIYTKNQTDFKVDQSELYYPKWGLSAPSPGDQYMTIVTRNPNESSPMGIMVGTSDQASFNDFIIKGYSYSGVLQIPISEITNYFFVVWNTGFGSLVQVEFTNYTSVQTTATPVITPTSDGKFSITCSTLGSTIYWRNSSRDNVLQTSYLADDWVEYDPNSPILPLNIDSKIQAVAYKNGMWMSQVTSNVELGYTFKKPTITVNTAPGSKYITIDSYEATYIHGLQFKFKINNGSTITYDSTSQYQVNTNDIVTAWATKTGPNYNDSDIETITVS